MILVRKVKKIRKVIKDIKDKGNTVGFVPTMGALHEGHLSLVRGAGRKCDVVVVSIFVNPTQFGPKEDFSKYPRQLRKDIQKLKSASVDILFAPDAAEMYPQGYSTYVNEEELSKEMCGLHREGHFRGVATVVTKLFNIIQPDVAIFGQKDYQQALIVKRITRDLNMPVAVEIAKTVREADGLAMSSRNAYLSEEERKKALGIYQALKRKKIVKKIDGVELEYFMAMDKDLLKPVKKIKKGTLLAIAARVGKTRLIDNIIV